MTDTTDLLRATAAIFGNRDRASRRVDVERVYARDVEFVDPEGMVVGWDALDDKIQKLLDGAPVEFTFVEDGPLYASSDTGALAWAFGPVGNPVVRGIDIMTITDGRISRLVTLLSA